MGSIARTNPPGVAWTEIRDAAVDAAGRGWPAVPGTFRSGDGRWYGRAGATELGPVADDWESAPVTDVDQALDIWTQKPFGVLLVCGYGVDVLELPSEVAELLPALAARGLTAPPTAAVMPPPRWLVYVATVPGQTLLPTLAMAGVVLRTRGDWVALPPTNLGHTRARWRVEPSDSQVLPDAAAVQQVLADALTSGFPGDSGH